METSCAQRLIRITLAAFTLVALVWLALARTQPAQAGPTDAVVTDCSFTGLANALNSGNGRITFNCNGSHAPATISVTQLGGLNVDNGVYWTIDGGSVITLSGGGNFRLFNVKTGGALTLTNMVLAHGYVGNNQNPLPSQGGALLNNGGRLVLDHATVRNSESVGATAYGGAIESAAGTTLLMDSTLYQNQSHVGGGIHVRAAR